ncbi:TPA: molecular chaperone [Klebsiella quasipneumoniae subsp. similipneumoniae]|nr:molecular chaperone [Klebsiella quasipneumoniae subsp. similipneumoniae]
MNFDRLIIKWFLALLMLQLPSYGHAIYLDSTIYEIPADKNFISKQIYNNSNKQNLYEISAVKLDKPGAGGENRSSVVDGELLFTPLSFSLQPGASNFFKIFYKGSTDATERYYRLLFREIPMTLFSERHHGKNSEAIPVVAIDTILIVRPRNINFSYTLDEKEGHLTNTGNTYFKVIVHNGCNSNDDAATIRYILPGETWNSPMLREMNKKFIVALQKYIPTGNGCF